MKIQPTAYTKPPGQLAPICLTASFDAPHELRTSLYETFPEDISPPGGKSLLGKLWGLAHFFGGCLASLSSTCVFGRSRINESHTESSLPVVNHIRRRKNPLIWFYKGADGGSGTLSHNRDGRAGESWSWGSCLGCPWWPVVMTVSLLYWRARVN